MAKENDAPTEIETITLTMSRPVAEAVQAACEWYLRLHMGQFGIWQKTCALQNSTRTRKTMRFRARNSVKTLLMLR